VNSENIRIHKEEVASFRLYHDVNKSLRNQVISSCRDLEGSGQPCLQKNLQHFENQMNSHQSHTSNQFASPAAI
jgi:hypothetical protein